VVTTIEQYFVVYAMGALTAADLQTLREASRKSSGNHI